MNRFEVTKIIRKRLQLGGISIGSWMQLPDASVAEIMGRAGYDWIAVDMEHGNIAHHQLPDLFRALELGNTLPLVRLVEGSTKECKQALDAGAGGVIVPMISSQEQLIAVRDACCWPPKGKRGVGFSRANLFGKYFEGYCEEAQAPLLVAMIENFHAVKNLEFILDVDGLDAILIGPYDLSASMGLTAQFCEPAFLNAMAQIRLLCSQKNVPCGVHVVTPDTAELRLRIEEGYRFLAYSIDSVFLNSFVQSPLLGNRGYGKHEDTSSDTCAYGQ